MVLEGFSHYEIYEDGAVYSHNAHKFMSCNLKRKDRYKNLVLYNDEGKPVNMYIHQMVATLFVPGWFEGAAVNHIDGNKHNNASSNLEWVSYSENAKHAYHTGLRVRADKQECFAGTSVYESITQLAKSEGITRGCAWYRVKKALTVDGKTYGLR